MTPIYASNRANIAGWYAYNLPIDARRVIWDGGAGHRDQGATGFWCPYTGNIVDAPDKMVKRMPNMALEGVICGDEMIVTGFPKVQHLIGTVLTKQVESRVDYLYYGDDQYANFIDEIAAGPWYLENTPCRVVPVEKLPDDKDEALRYFRQKYPFGLCRNPYAVWTPMRTVFLMANVKPEVVRYGRIREIFHSEDLEIIDYVTVWSTIEKEMKVIPLYHGDNEGDCNFWKSKAPITLYCLKDMVIGYE